MQRSLRLSPHTINLILDITTYNGYILYTLYITAKKSTDRPRKSSTLGPFLPKGKMERESIWSVKVQHRPLFILVFLALFVLGVILSFCYETTSLEGVWIIKFIFRLFEYSGKIGISSIVLTFVLFEGGTVMGVLADYLSEKRIQKGRQEGTERALKAAAELDQEGRLSLKALEEKINEGRKTPN